MQMLDPHNLPDKKVEEFKYSDLRKLLARFGGAMPAMMPVVQGAAVVAGQVINVTGNNVVIVDDLTIDAGQWLNRGFIINIAPRATCTYIRLIQGQGAMTDQITVNVGASAACRVVHVHAGTAIARTTIEMNIDADADAHIYGVQMLGTGAHGDLTTTIHHTAPRAVSVQRMRNVVDAGARGVYQGKIHVAPLAQKTDATQQSKSILLAATAEMDTKPELQIFADDVSCAHGATTGALDQNQMFYAMSRGLDENQARALLLRAFLTADLPVLPDTWNDRIAVLIDGAMEGRGS